MNIRPRIRIGLLRFFILLASAAFPSTIKADGVEAIFPLIVKSDEGTCFFKMVPVQCRFENGETIIEREPFGVAYSLERDGSFRELWKVSGWYARRGFLSNDGRYFVRIGPWAKDSKNFTDLAAAFYDRGKPLKEYAVRDLLTDTAAVDKSVSHYTWVPEVQTVPTGFDEETFRLVLVDKTVCNFDFSTGERLETGVDPGARSSQELYMALERKCRLEGIGMFEKSMWRAGWEAAYTFSAISSRRKPFNVFFDDDGWSADLTPKQSFSFPCLAEACFPVSKEGNIEVKLGPEEVTGAFQAALAHPAVTAWIKSKSATGIRLRTTGDRLHWNTAEISGWLESATAQNIPSQELRNWAYFILDTGKGYHSFYLNAHTGDILLEDVDTSPRELIHLNAKGGNIPVRRMADSPPPSGDPK